MSDLSNYISCVTQYNREYIVIFRNVTIDNNLCRFVKRVRDSFLFDVQANSVRNFQRSGCLIFQILTVIKLCDIYVCVYYYYYK